MKFVDKSYNFAFKARIGYKSIMLEDSNCENQIEISDEPSLGSKILTDIKIRFSIDMSVFSNKKHFFIKKFNISFNDKSFTYVIPYNVSIPVLYQYSKLGLNLKVFTPDKLKELSDFCVQLRNEIINCEEKGEIVKVYVSIEPYMNLELIKEKIRCFEKECKYIYIVNHLNLLLKFRILDVS